MRSIRRTAPKAAPAPPPETRRAYVVRAVNLKWQAKRTSDGEIIAEHDERAGASHVARSLGFFLTY